MLSASCPRLPETTSNPLLRRGYRCRLKCTVVGRPELPSHCLIPPVLLPLLRARHRHKHLGSKSHMSELDTCLQSLRIGLESFCYVSRQTRLTRVRLAQPSFPWKLV